MQISAVTPRTALCAPVNPQRWQGPLRVLTPDLAERLSLVNSMWPALCRAGLRPLGQDLRLGSSQPPLLFLPRVTETVRRHMPTIRIVINDDGSRSQQGRVLGVDLRWPLANTAVH